MKFSIHTRLILTLALLTSSCSDECMHEEVATATDNAICFTFDKPATTRALLDDNYESTWQIGDEVGVYAVVTGGTLSATASENFLHNVKLTYNGTTWQPEEKLYWPNTGGTFDFYAYYPYSVSATDPANIAFSVETNQSTLTNSCQSDLLASEKVTKSAGEIVYLPFQHMLAMVELKVPYQIGAVINPSATTDASLRRVNAQCSLNLSTQVVTETPISNFDMKNMWQNIRMYRKEQPEDLDYNYSYTYRAYIPAQTLLTRDRLFLFADHEQQDTIILGHEVPEEITLVKGVATKFSCALCEDDGTIPVEYIPAGTYMMGSTPEDIAFYTSNPEFSNLTNETQHQVTLTKPFLMGAYEITCSQFAEFLNAVDVEADGKYANAADININKVLIIDCRKKEYSTQSSEDSQKKENGLVYNTSTSSWEPINSTYANHPITHVSWSGAYEYAKWKECSLPTEAQWEYACRAGETSYSTFAVWDYDNDGTINEAASDYAWFGGNNRDDDTHPVGQKKPNAWGLYDMRGNVYEYCLDTYNEGYYTTEAKIDPTGPATDSSGKQNMKILRGGSWLTSELRTRSAFKFTTTNAQSGETAQQQWGMDSHFGFRIVKNLE